MSIRIVIIWCLLLGFPTKKFAQINKKAERSKYLSFLDKGNEFQENGYHYQIEKASDGKIIYKQFYPSTKQLTHYITYDKYMAYFDGKYMDWLDNGKLWKSGFYDKGVPSGEWKFYYNDKVTSYGQLKNGKKEGVWTALDSLEQTTSLFTYEEGILNGIFQEFDSLGILENEGIMQDGEILSQTKAIKNDTTIHNEQMPLFKGCEHIQEYEQKKMCADKKLLEYIYSNIKYPKLARRRGISGSAMIQFVIDEEGRITDITTLRGICKEIEAECLRIIKGFPTWQPGMQNDKPVRVQFNLPINFRLE